MNIKNRKGITVAVLVITLLVMATLFSITFTTSMRLLKTSQKKKMKTMLYMVKSRAEILLDEYLFENEGKDLSEVMITDIQDALGGIYITNVEELQRVGYEIGSYNVPSREYMIYCAWEEDELKNQGIDTKNLADGDTIIIQYNILEETVDVASRKGFSSAGVSIHALRDF